MMIEYFFIYYFFILCADEKCLLHDPSWHQKKNSKHIKHMNNSENIQANQEMQENNARLFMADSK